ncbi:MAG: DUF4397 domain-containing protein [Spirosomataceae bacterium]
MKKIISNILLATGLTIFLMACGSEFDLLKDVQSASGARVKFVHAAADAPGVALYVNDKKFSGILTVSPATPGVVTYGNVYPINDYALVEAGTAKAKLIAPAVGTTPETTVFDGSLPVEADKYYSVFAAGLAPTYGAAIIEDKIPAFNDRVVFFRVINMVSNATALSISIGSTMLADKVAYGKASEFVAYDLPSTFTGGAINFSGITLVTEGTGGVKNTLTAANLNGVTAGRVVTYVVRGLLPTTPTGTTKYAISNSVYFNR